MEIKRIMVATELDDLSGKATQYALQLAGQLGIKEVVLLNTIIPVQTQAYSATGDVIPAGSAMADRLSLTLKKKHLALLQAEAEKYDVPGIHIKPVVGFSDNKSDLDHFMDECKADLLVCGSRDENTFLEKLFGTTTGEMARKSNYPMVVIKEESSLEPVRDIALAIDIGADSQPGLMEVVQLSRRLNARLQLVHVITNDDQSTDRAIEKLHDLALDHHMTGHAIHVINNQSLEHGLRSFIRNNNPSMVAVLSRGKGKLRNLIFGSHTEDILLDADKPVLVSKEH
jgi:nucleotide-binding universal stress UspA family protein